MNWVMGRALPDDVPIEAEDGDQGHRAGPEHGRGPQRRDPQGRPQVRRGDERAAQGDLRPAAADPRRRGPASPDTEELLERRHRQPWSSRPARATTPRSGTSTRLLDRGCASTTRPSSPSSDLAEATTAGQVIESAGDRGHRLLRAQHSDAMPGGGRDGPPLEREVMLQLIDQRWREHLSEMDYLREGIDLRAMGQQDPLVAWQREGYAMFGQLMAASTTTTSRYVMHVEARCSSRRPRGSTWPGACTRRPTTRWPAPPCHRAGSWPDAGRRGWTRLAAAAAPARTSGRRPAAAAPGTAHGPARQVRPARDRAPPEPAPGRRDARDPVVKAPDAEGRPQRPCWCGSGKKFKFCHGAA